MRSNKNLLSPSLSIINEDVATTSATTTIIAQSAPFYPSSKFDAVPVQKKFDSVQVQKKFHSVQKSFYFGVQVFSYDELQEATKNFDPSMELGDGGFGTVYYGNKNIISQDMLLSTI